MDGKVFNCINALDDHWVEQVEGDRLAETLKAMFTAPSSHVDVDWIRGGHITSFMRMSTVHTQQVKAAFHKLARL
jgi:hypothetical protein